MNEASSILVLAIVGVWFFTSPRFQAFLGVVKSNSPGPKPGTPEYYQQNQTWDPNKQSTNPTFEEGKNGVQQPTGGQMS